MAKFSVDGDAVRKLADILVDTDLSEIEYEDEGRRIRVVRQGQVAPMTYAPPVLPTPHPATNDNLIKAHSAETTSSAANHPGVVKSPMVGTVYLSAEPGLSPFVKVGDRVEQGQTLLIIEAMKVMNQLKAPRSGIIKEFFAKDSMPVEYGEPLLIIE